MAVDRLTGDWFRMWHPIKDIVFMFDYTKLHTISEDVHVIINVNTNTEAECVYPWQQTIKECDTFTKQTVDRHLLFSI